VAGRAQDPSLLQQIDQEALHNASKNLKSKLLQSIDPVEPVVINFRLLAA
jgi:hypothetical protein